MGKSFSCDLICVIEDVIAEKPAVEKIVTEMGRSDYALHIHLIDLENSQKSKEFMASIKEKAVTFLKKGNNTIEYSAKKDVNKYVVYNEALKQSSSDYIAFFDTSAEWKSAIYTGSKFIAEVFKAFETFGVPVVSLTPFQNMNDRSTKLLAYDRNDCEIDLNENPYYSSMFLEACFFDRKKIQDLEFSLDDQYESDKIFLLKVYDRVRKYGVIKPRCVLKKYQITDAYNNAYLFDKDWYTRQLREVYLPLLKEKNLSQTFQAGLVWLIELRFAGNQDDRNKTVIQNEEIDEFMAAVHDVLQYIDDDVLAQVHWRHKRPVGRTFAKFLIDIKYDFKEQERAFDPHDEEYGIKYAGVDIERLENIKAEFLAINYKGGKLVFDGRLLNVYGLYDKDIKLAVNIGGQKIYAVRNGVYALNKFFGRTAYRQYTFAAEVDERALEAAVDGQFSISLLYKGAELKLACIFPKLASRLTHKLERSYWVFGKYILSYNNEGKFFNLESATRKSMTRHEKKFRREMLSTMIHGDYSLASILSVLLLRFICTYKRLHPSDKQIWVTYDQLFKAGDNGDYFYRYMNEHHREIETYYIVNKDTKEYKEFNDKYHTALAFNEFKAKLKSLEATYVFATRVDVGLYCGLHGKIQHFLKDLFHAEVVCLQHGLTIQKIAQYQNRIFDNTQLYYLVSPYEGKNLSHYVYDYKKEQLLLTGAPRYDGLYGETKKQILLAPTWRRNVTQGTNVKGKAHNYSVNFKNTTYYQIYNGLLNDKTIIECAKKYGYKLIYLVHPIISPNLADFEENEYVKIQSGITANYEQMLKESCLMVTDYSGIQFDFTYMRKPLIYYRPTELPAQYDEEDLGLGPVCETKDEIVRTLCKYMENGCKLEQKYLDNINEFFPFADQNNCQRVYEATMKVIEQEMRC